MDYDLTNIPAGYDRGRDHGPEVLDLWMNAVESHLEGQTVTRILDLGCGTGRFSEGLAVRFSAEVIGLDPSTKMLERAREKRRGAGFRTVASEIVTQTIAPDWAAFAEKLAAGGDSVLARLSLQDFEAGLAALRSHAATVDGHPIIEPVDLFVFR